VCQLVAPLHVEPDIEREGGPGAEGGAAGDAERQRDVLLAEPDDDGGGPDGDEHGPADAADHPEEGQLGVADRHPGHDAGQSLHQQPEHEGPLHADRGGEHAAGNVREPVADDVERDEEAQRPDPDLELRPYQREGRGDVEPVEGERDDAQADHGEHAPSHGAVPGAAGGGHMKVPLAAAPSGRAQVRSGWQTPAAAPQGCCRVLVRAA